MVFEYIESGNFSHSHYFPDASALEKSICFKNTKWIISLFLFPTGQASPMQKWSRAPKLFIPKSNRDILFGTTRPNRLNCQ